MSLRLPVAILAALSLTSSDRVVGLYDGPLMRISHARLATLHSSRMSVRLLRRKQLQKIEKLNANAADDVRGVRERVVNEDETVALEYAESRVRDCSKAVVLALNPSDRVDVIFG
jgi:hypothetical protein